MTPKTMLGVSLLSFSVVKLSVGGAISDGNQIPCCEKPSIRITINPEARVSAAWLDTRPRSTSCGEPIQLGVLIVNEGFVTAPLEAQLVGGERSGVTLEFTRDRLKGVLNEWRQLRIILANPGISDITIAFTAHNVSPDLGGRDRVHFVMSCLGPAEKKL